MISANKHYKELLNMIKRLTYSHGTWEIFNDFLEMSAISISNAVDTRQFEGREKQYLSIIGKYAPEQQTIFAEMLAELVLALEYEYQAGSFVDVLGKLFHDLELHNKYKGQFFTPQHICTMMGKMLLGDSDAAIAERGFIPLLEPTCGSGAMVLGFAQAMRDSGYNHSEQLLVTAIDIDIKCVYMCYLQLSLYGIPAAVIHGNSLSNEVWSTWYTPVYIFGGWSWRSRRPAGQPESPDSVSNAEVIMPTPKEATAAYEQLNLFSQSTGEMT